MNAYRLLLADVRAAMGWRVPALVLLMAFVGLTEGLSVALLLPLLSRIGIAAEGGSGNFAAALESALAWIDPQAGAGTVLVVLIGVAMMQAGLFLFLSWWTAVLSRRYEADWQIRLFHAFARARWPFLTAHKSGELTNAVVMEVTRLAGAFQIMTQIIAAAIVAVIYLVFAFLISAKVTLSLVAVALLMMLSVARLYRTSFDIGEAVGPLNARLQVLTGEYLGGIKIVKAMVGEARAIARLEEVVRALERAKRMAGILPSMVRGLFEFIAFCALAALFVFGAQVLDVTPTNVLVVLALFARLMPRILTLQNLAHNLNTYVPAIVPLRELLDTAEAHAERSLQSGAPLVAAMPTSLDVSNLAVAYGDHRVLDSVDLSIPVPGMVGIVGGSGAGKSTLVHALIGLVPAVAGEIRIGACDLVNTPLATWRGAIAYVPQETILFHATVRENLLLGRPTASHEELIAAARSAHAHDFIMALPQGYDTPIGDQGVLLSGGQRQRLGIARALLTQPLILLMDEPTSSLDPESEQEILATLEELRGRVGIAIVAHRLATVRGADLIYVLEEGRVVEAGRWSDLIAKRNRLHALARLQHIVA